MAKQTSGQASQSQKTSESQKTAKKTTKKTEHVLEQTPKSLLIGTGMTLLGGAMWGMNSTVAKLLMRDYQLDPIWLSCVRALFASLIFLVGSAITTPQKLAGAVKDVKSYPKYLVTTLICVLSGAGLLPDDHRLDELRNRHRIADAQPDLRARLGMPARQTTAPQA